MNKNKFIIYNLCLAGTRTCLFFPFTPVSEQILVAERGSTVKSTVSNSSEKRPATNSPSNNPKKQRVNNSINEGQAQNTPRKTKAQLKQLYDQYFGSSDDDDVLSLINEEDLPNDITVTIDNCTQQTANHPSTDLQVTIPNENAIESNSATVAGVSNPSLKASIPLTSIIVVPSPKSTETNQFRIPRVASITAKGKRIAHEPRERERRIKTVNSKISNRQRAVQNRREERERIEREQQRERERVDAREARRRQFEKDAEAQRRQRELDTKREIERCTQGIEELNAEIEYHYRQHCIASGKSNRLTVQQYHDKRRIPVNQPQGDIESLKRFSELQETLQRDFNSPPHQFHASSVVEYTPTPICAPQKYGIREENNRVAQPSTSREKGEWTLPSFEKTHNSYRAENFIENRSSRQSVPPSFSIPPLPTVQSKTYHVADSTQLVTPKLAAVAEHSHDELVSHRQPAHTTVDHIQPTQTVNNFQHSPFVAVPQFAPGSNLITISLKEYESLTKRKSKIGHAKAKRMKKAAENKIRRELSEAAAAAVAEAVAKAGISAISNAKPA